MKITRKSIMASTDKDYASLKGVDFKKARDILTKDGFHEHEYGDKDDNNGYAVYRKGDKEVELTYEWVEGKRKGEAHAGKVINVYVDDDVNAGCTKKSVKASAGNSVELTFICPDLETGRSVVDKAREIGGFGSTWNETKWVYIDVPSTQSVDNVDDLIDYAQSIGVYLNKPSAKLIDDWADSKAQTVLRGCTEKPVKASAVMGAMDIENLTIYVPSYCYVDVMVDSYEQGEGEQVNSWTFQVADGFRTAQELIDDIAESSGIFSNDINDYVVLDSSLQTDATVNAENDIPTEEELEAWKRGELELYVAHLWVRLQVGSKTHDMTEDEAEAFGLSVY